LTHLVVQSRGIEVRIGRSRLEREAALVALERRLALAEVLERNGQVEVQRSVVGEALQRLRIDFHRFAAAAAVAQQRAEIQAGVRMAGLQYEYAPVCRLGLVEPALTFERLCAAELQFGVVLRALRAAPVCEQRHRAFL